MKINTLNGLKMRPVDQTHAKIKMRPEDQTPALIRMKSQAELKSDTPRADGADYNKISGPPNKVSLEDLDQGNHLQSPTKAPLKRSLSKRSFSSFSDLAGNFFEYNTKNSSRGQ